MTVILGHLIFDGRLVPPVFLALAAALLLGEVLEIRDRRRIDRMRLRLGSAARIVRFDEPLTATSRIADWQATSVRIGRVAGRFLPQRVVSSYTALLMRAGRSEPAMPPLFITVKLLTSIGGAAVAGLVVGAALQAPVPALAPMTAGGLLVGYLLPDLWLQRQITAYTRALRTAIPMGIDLLSVALEGGMGFDGAVGHLCARVDDPFGREMQIYLRLRNLGHGRKAALDQVADRTDMPEMRTFTTAVAQGDELGIGIVSLLRDLATDLRTRERQRVATQMQTASVRMMFPIILFIMPSIFIVLLGPAIGAVLNGFG